MLLVKTVVKQSVIAGVGLFADQDIKRGDIVWQFTPETCATFATEQFQVLIDSFHKTEKQLIQYFLTYTYYQRCINSLIFCLDDGRFVNHSEHPNLASPLHLSRELGWQCSAALDDIKRGEELTENYRSYDSSDWLDALCKRYEVYHYEQELSVS
jgi:uncharacterized protein